MLESPDYHEAYLDLPLEMFRRFHRRTFRQFSHVSLQFRWSDGWGKPRRGYPPIITIQTIEGMLRARLSEPSTLHSQLSTRL